MRSDLPEIRGQYRFDAPLSKTNWFGVGGNAEILFKPEDTQDLAHFLKHKPADLPVIVIGVGSNLIVRDGGLAGVVIRLGRFFNEAVREGDVVIAGAAMLDLNLARIAAGMGRAGLEFLSGIPGTVGGALAMNAGAYGSEVKDVLVQAEAVTPAGEIVMLSVADMKYSYRHYGGPSGLIFTRAWFATTQDVPEMIEARMAEIQAKREATQPIRERTGGSTFANPEGHKAWELIDAAGCRGLTIGGAQMSALHCNFMINTGTATAADLETLGEQVRARVLAQSGVELRWKLSGLGEKITSMIQKLPATLSPSWLVRFFARCVVLPLLFIWLYWLVRQIVAQPEMILHAPIEDWGMSLLMLLMLYSGLQMATYRIALYGDIIEKRTIFGSKRIRLSEIDCRCHYYGNYTHFVNLYFKNTPKRIFRPDMRVPVGWFSLGAAEEILKFIEPIPVSDHCVYWQNSPQGD